MSETGALSQEDVEQAKEILEEESQAVKGSWEDALAPDEIEWEVKTGRTRNGHPVTVTVKAVDPGNQALLMEYMMSQDKDAAAKSLWEACIKEPKELVQNFDDLMSGFRLNVTYKILTMLGFNEDFLQTIGSLGQSQTTTQAPSASFTGSQESMDETQKMLEDGSTESSSTPTTSQESSKSSDEQTESKTSPSSKQTQTRKSESSTPTSDEEAEEASDEDGTIRIE